LILFFAILLRSWNFGTLPDGLHQDEAMLAYNAWADIEYGMDMNGDHNPVYSVAWGSGQNAGYNYVIRPFIKMFGLNIVSIRLPMLMLGIISLFFFYLLLKHFFGTGVALLGFFILAFNPWHIMISRWALECNLAPLLFLPAVYFTAISPKKPAFFILGMFLLGLSSYGYVTVLMLFVIFIPLMVWHVFYHKIIPAKYAIFGFLTFVLVSAPLAMCIFINTFDFPAFNFLNITVPRMTVLRSASTVSFNIDNFKHFGEFMLAGYEGHIYNAIPPFGALYPFMLAFIVFGIYVLFVKYRNEAFEMKFWFISAVIMALVISININRINMIFFPLIFLATLGVAEIHRKAKFVIPVFAILVIATTIGFAKVYFTEFNDRSRWAYHWQFDKAVEYAVQNVPPNATIYFGHVPYSLVLYATKMPPQIFLNTRVWVNPNWEFRHPIRFDRFATGIPHYLQTGDIGIFTEHDSKQFHNNQVKKVTKFGNYVVIEN